LKLFDIPQERSRSEKSFRGARRHRVQSRRLEKANDPGGGGTRRGHPRIMPLGFGRGTFF
jgi:hypothetical protein